MAMTKYQRVSAHDLWHTSKNAKTEGRWTELPTTIHSWRGNLLKLLSQSINFPKSMAQRTSWIQIDCEKRTRGALFWSIRYSRAWGNDTGLVRTDPEFKDQDPKSWISQVRTMVVYISSAPNSIHCGYTVPSDPDRMRSHSRRHLRWSAARSAAGQPYLRAHHLHGRSCHWYRNTLHPGM